MTTSRSWCCWALLVAACATTPAPKAAAPEGPLPPPPPAVAWSPSPPPGPLPAVATVAPPHRERTLRNGLRIVVVEQRRRPLVGVRLVFPIGAAAEHDSVAGVTSMALALLCERFERRNSEDELIVWDEKSARRLVADVGGTLRSFVSPDSSGLAIDGYAVDAARYLRTMNDVVQDRRHGIDGFTGRRDGVLDVIDDLELGDDATMFERLFELAFGKRHPYARRMVGTKSSVGALGMEDVINVQERLLHPHGAVLLIVGDVDAAAMLSKAAEVFGSWSQRGELIEAIAVPTPPVTKRQSVVVIPRRPARTTALCAARPLTDTQATNGAVAVFAEVVGTHRLHDALREGPGLTYSTSAAGVRRRSARALLLCTRLPTKDTSDGLGLFLKTLEAVRQSPPTEDEVERSKAVLISRLQGSYDSVASSTQTWLSALDLHESPSVDAQIAEVRAVTAAQLKGLADQVLRLDALQLVLSGEPLQLEKAIKANQLGKIATVRSAHE